jgi:hypothetical protein
LPWEKKKEKSKEKTAQAVKTTPHIKGKEPGIGKYLLQRGSEKKSMGIRSESSQCAESVISLQ